MRTIIILIVVVSLAIVVYLFSLFYPQFKEGSFHGTMIKGQYIKLEMNDEDKKLREEIININEDLDPIIEGLHNYYFFTKSFEYALNEIYSVSNDFGIIENNGLDTIISNLNSKSDVVFKNIKMLIDFKNDDTSSYSIDVEGNMSDLAFLTQNIKSSIEILDKILKTNLQINPDDSNYEKRSYFLDLLKTEQLLYTLMFNDANLLHELIKYDVFQYNATIQFLKIHNYLNYEAVVFNNLMGYSLNDRWYDYYLPLNYEKLGIFFNENYKEGNLKSEAYYAPIGDLPGICSYGELLQNGFIDFVNQTISDGKMEEGLTGVQLLKILNAQKLILTQWEVTKAEHDEKLN